MTRQVKRNEPIKVGWFGDRSADHDAHFVNFRMRFMRFGLTKERRGSPKFGVN